MRQSSLELTVEEISSLILMLRGKKVMLDHDLARLYKVPTKVLNQAVKRNKKRFPDDFMFQLTPEEKNRVVTNCDHLKQLKFSPVLPYAFTEHGALMLANILHSAEAMEISISIVRAFIKLRELFSTNKELVHKLAELERKLGTHDEAIRNIVAAIHQLMAPMPVKPKPRIGFHP